jgi:hypothetical protein
MFIPGYWGVQFCVPGVSFTVSGAMLSHPAISSSIAANSILLIFLIRLLLIVVDLGDKYPPGKKEELPAAGLAYLDLAHPDRLKVSLTDQ